MWDYHVVLAVNEEHGVEVWDLDCTAGAPLAATEWARVSFSAALAEMFAPRFRLIAADVFEVIRVEKVEGFLTDAALPDQEVTPTGLRTELRGMNERLDRIIERFTQHA